MAKMTPEQVRTRQRVETVISLMAPVLNTILGVGDRISRIAEPEDADYYPPRMTQAEPPPRAVVARPGEPGHGA